MERYYVIPQDFAKTNKGYERNENRFDYAKTIDEMYVCSIHSLLEFPELFETLESWEPVIVHLEIEDFPQPETNIE